MFRFTSQRGSDNSPSAPSVTAPRGGLTTIRTPVTALRGAANGGRIVVTGKRRRQRPNGADVSDEDDSGFEEEDIDSEQPQFTEEDRRSSSVSGGRRKLNRIPSGSDFSDRRKPVNSATEADDITGIRFTGRRRLRPTAPSGPSGPAELAENDDDNLSAEDYEVTAPGAAVVNTEYEDIFPPPVLPNIQPDIQISTVG